MTAAWSQHARGMVKFALKKKTKKLLGKGPGQHIIRCIKNKKCEKENESGNFQWHCGTKDLRACWQLTATCARPSDARIATTVSLFIRVLFYCAQRFKSRAHLRNSTESVGIGPTTALLPASALPKISARPSDARPSITALCFTDRTCAATRRRTGLNHLSQHLTHWLPARDNQASGQATSPSFCSKVYAALVKT